MRVSTICVLYFFMNMWKHNSVCKKALSNIYTVSLIKKIKMFYRVGYRGREEGSWKCTWPSHLQGEAKSQSVWKNLFYKMLCSQDLYLWSQMRLKEFSFHFESNWEHEWFSFTWVTFKRKATVPEISIKIIHYILFYLLARWLESL